MKATQTLAAVQAEHRVTWNEIARSGERVRQHQHIELDLAN
jgi:hypothetical protein